MYVDRVIFMVSLALAVALADAAAAAKIYKWTDEKGVTHYGESIPPEYKDHAATEMSTQGLTVRKLDPANTAEQRKATDEKAAHERAEKQRAFEQRRRDMALVNTYTSPKEIDDARDRTLQLPMQVIRTLEPRLKRAQDKLSNLQQQAASLTNAGKSVPDGLGQDIVDQRAEVDSLKAEVERHQAQVQAVKTKYEEDKKRYLELTQR
jgi:chromosome segregation ATPase